jgi:hypothetical protein
MRGRSGQSCMLISHVSPKERALIEAAIAFANLGTIESNRQVEELFSALNIPGADFRHVEETSQEYKLKTQPRLRQWLRQVIGSNGGRAQAASEVPQYIPRDGTAFPVFSLDRLWFDFQVNSVDAGCALAVALILDRDRGLTGRLQQCTLSTCGRFNVDFDASLRPRPRKYCSVTHRTLANYEQSPERMRQWRKAA